MERASSDEDSIETEDQQSWEDMAEKEQQRMDEEDEIQERLQPLFEEEERNIHEEREQHTYAKKLTEERKIIRKVIYDRHAYRKRAANDEKWRPEMEPKWPIPRAWLPELTAEQRKLRKAIKSRGFAKRYSRKKYAEERAAKLEKSRKIER